MTGPRFFLITNDGPRAALAVNCHMGNLPPSIAVVDDPTRYADVPNGAKCLGLWYGSDSLVAPAKNLWLARRDRGGIDFISDDVWDRILAWATDPTRPSPVAAPVVAAAPEQISQPIPEAEVPHPAPSAERRKARWS
jgi:hypothetical protein